MREAENLIARWDGGGRERMGMGGGGEGSGGVKETASEGFKLRKWHFKLSK